MQIGHCRCSEDEAGDESLTSRGRHLQPTLWCLDASSGSGSYPESKGLSLFARGIKFSYIILSVMLAVAKLLGPSRSVMTVNLKCCKDKVINKTSALAWSMLVWIDVRCILKQGYILLSPLKSRSTE